MIGELDYSGLFYSNDNKENIFSGVAMLFVAGFVVLIILALSNFLVGTAAVEIQVRNIECVSQ